VTEVPVSTEEKEKDTRMKLAQEMLITAKDEEDHIFETVDYHATQIAKELDQQRREFYIEFRDNLMHERFVRTEAQRAVKRIEQRRLEGKGERKGKQRLKQILTLQLP